MATRPSPRQAPPRAAVGRHLDHPARTRQHHLEAAVAPAAGAASRRRIRNGSAPAWALRPRCAAGTASPIASATPGNGAARLMAQPAARRCRASARPRRRRSGRPRARRTAKPRCANETRWCAGERDYGSASQSAPACARHSAMHSNGVMPPANNGWLEASWASAEMILRRTDHQRVADVHPLVHRGRSRRAALRSPATPRSGSGCVSAGSLHSEYWRVGRPAVASTCEPAAKAGNGAPSALWSGCCVSASIDLRATRTDNEAAAHARPPSPRSCAADARACAAPAPPRSVFSDNLPYRLGREVAAAPRASPGLPNEPWASRIGR